MIELTPTSSSSSILSSSSSTPIKRQLSSPPTEENISYKKPYTGTSMIDILQTTHLAPSRGKEEEEEEETVTVKKDKGKGKMKISYLPELPDEIWTRIFEIYYEDKTNQWQSTAVFKDGSIPILLSKDHARIAIPVLYRHPYIGYKAIPAFISTMLKRSQYTGLLYKDYIKHLTIRPSPIIPSLEFASFYGIKRPTITDERGERAVLPTPYTIHNKFEELMRNLPKELNTFTLKDTLIKHQSDSTLLFSGLNYIQPKKVKLEFRLWDLYDSPFGQDIIGATRSGSYTSYGNRPIVPATNDLGGNNNRNPPSPNGGGALTGYSGMQKDWRDALYNNTELDLPPWWIEPSRPDHPPPAPAQPPPAIHGFGTWIAPPQNPVNIHNASLAHQPPPPNPTPSLHTRTYAPYTSNQPSSSTSASQPGATPTAQDRRMNRAPEQISTQNHLRQIYTEARIRAARNQRFRLPVSTSPDPSDRPGSSNTGTTRGSISQVLSSRSGPAESSTSTSRTGHSTQMVVDVSSTDDSSNGEDDYDILSDHALNSVVLTRASSTVSPVTGISRTSQAIAGSSSTNAAPRYSEASLRRSSAQSSNSVTQSSTQATVPAPNRGRPSGTRINVRNRLASSETSNIQIGAGGVPVTYAPGMVSYNLAHYMRALLLILIRDAWMPKIQALSIVALDPLSSLIVRSPQLDFWTQIGIPHIRVHLPRSINSLSIFKGPKEVARDRARRRREQGDLNNDQNAAAPAAAPAAPGAGGGNGNGPAQNVNGLNIAQAAALVQMHQQLFQQHPQQTPEDDDANYRIVGGDGNGNGLIHEEVKLFEVEINSIEEMRDEVWFRYGDQLPPQLCRILAGEHDWRDVTLSNWNDTYSPPYSEYIPPDSPATSDFDSPTFSFVSLDDDEIHHIDEDDEENENNTYDRSKAEEQAKRVKERGMRDD